MDNVNWKKVIAFIAVLLVVLAVAGYFCVEFLGMGGAQLGGVLSTLVTISFALVLFHRFRGKL